MPTADVQPAVALGGLKVVAREDRTYVLLTQRGRRGEITRRFESRVINRFENISSVEWAYDPQQDEVIDDFAVHPSGDVSLTIETPTGYRVVRKRAPDGFEFARYTVRADTVPATELGELPPNPFLMRSNWSQDALYEGWVRIAAVGENAVIAFQSTVAAPNGEPSLNVASAVSWLTFSPSGYTESATHVVDGLHGVGPAAWTYDEFRWRQAAVRPYLAVDSSTGDVIVGRAWNNRRCESNVNTFREFTQAECVFNAVSPVENERLPFAWTVYLSDGTRRGTHVWIPPRSREFVVFDMGAANGTTVLAGARVEEDANEMVRYYDTDKVPYDGYLAMLGTTTGMLYVDRTIDDEGRGDMLSCLYVNRHGVLAGGASGWDRWNGGMSISRQGNPWIVTMGFDGTVFKRGASLLGLRIGGIGAFDGGVGSVFADRHTHLLGITQRENTTMAEVVGVGLADAPMTHSGDGNNTFAMAFGGLTLNIVSSR